MTALPGVGFVLAAAALSLGDAGSVVAFKVGPGTEVTVDALARTITVKGPAQIEPTALCPNVTRDGNVVRLLCTTRRLRARIEEGKQGRILQIDQLRGTPIIDGDATLPVFGYPPEEFGLGGPCPGDTKSAQAECDFQVGAWGAATSALNSLLDGGLNAHASLRLGDAAYYSDNIELAAQLWDRAGSVGPFSRLAAVRLCDAMDACDDPNMTGLPYSLLSPEGVSETVGDEIILRHARMLAYDGLLEEAVGLLIANERSCARAPALCMRIVLQRLREADGPCPDALALGASLGQHLESLPSSELAMRLASEAADAGAHIYGANVLSTAALTAPLSEREGPLVRAAELYVEGGDVARAAVLVRFAEARLAPLRERARWNVVLKKLAEQTASTLPPSPEPR